MLRAILDKFWKQHSTKQQLHGHQPPMSKTVEIRRARHVVHCWRSKVELISGVLWAPSNGLTRVGWPTRIFLKRLCTDTWCRVEDLLEVMDERESGKSAQAARYDDDISLDIYIYIYIYIYIQSLSEREF